MMRLVVHRYTSDMTVNHYQYLVSSIDDVIANENIIVHVLKGSAPEDYFMVPTFYNLNLYSKSKVDFILQNSNNTIAKIIGSQLRRYPDRRHSLKEINDLSNIVHGNHIIILVIELFSRMLLNFPYQFDF